MKKILQILLYLAGFPLLIALVVIESLPIIQSGISYGVMVFVGLILTVVMALIYFAVTLIMAKRGKKSIYRQTFVSVIVAVACLGGLWVAGDIFLPDFLADKTSNTIYYEDLADDYLARAKVNEELLNEFIKLNIANGNLDKGKKDVYYAEGAKNAEIATLLETNFKSIDKDGYATFVGPWLDLANGDRMTIPALIHLIINKRETEGLPFVAATVDPENDEKYILTDEAVLWCIMDMLGKPMEFDLGADGMNVIPQNFTTILSSSLVQNAINNLLSAALDTTLANENIVGSPIYIRLLNGTVLTIIPTNEERGVLDYQSMAWLNSNGLIYAIVSVFAVRKLFLIFAGVIAVASYAIGLLRDDGKKNTVKGKGGIKVYSDKPAEEPKISIEGEMVSKYMPIESSYVVVDDPDKLDYNKVLQQFAEDSNNKVSRKYSSKEFNK